MSMNVFGVIQVVITFVGEHMYARRQNSCLLPFVFVPHVGGNCKNDKDLTNAKFVLADDCVYSTKQMTKRIVMLSITGDDL